MLPLFRPLGKFKTSVKYFLDNGLVFRPSPQSSFSRFEGPQASPPGAVYFVQPSILLIDVFEAKRITYGFLEPWNCQIFLPYPFSTPGHVSGLFPDPVLTRHVSPMVPPAFTSPPSDRVTCVHDSLHFTSPTAIFLIYSLPSPMRLLFLHKCVVVEYPLAQAPFFPN